MVASLMSALPGSVAQGLIWGILAIGGRNTWGHDELKNAFQLKNIML